MLYWAWIFLLGTSKPSALFCIQFNFSLLKYHKFSIIITILEGLGFLNLVSWTKADVCLHGSCESPWPHLFSSNLFSTSTVASTLQVHLFPIPYIFLVKTHFSTEFLTQSHSDNWFLLFRHQSPVHGLEGILVFCSLPQCTALLFCSLYFSFSFYFTIKLDDKTSITSSLYRVFFFNTKQFLPERMRNWEYKVSNTVLIAIF